MFKRFAFATALLLAPAGVASAQSLEDIFAPTATDGVVAMEHILAAARQDVDGVVTEIELERKKGRWIYEVEVARDKEKVELVYDAHSGALLSRKRD
ncbi:PepSY domain-containing protein [Methylocystis parvus]|uniref:PepSY domain-containing protein n=1 Tax=Methylocystis parvus TaxID=134 RepID=UPI003C722AF8